MLETGCLNMRTMIKKAFSRIGTMLINYVKLLLIPFVFVFMLIALFIKGIKILIIKCIDWFSLR